MPRDPAILLLERSLDTEAAEGLRLRYDVAERLAQIVCMPESRIAPSERHLAGDVLMQLVRTAPIAIRKRCAERLAAIVDAPKAVLRYLAQDEIEVAAPLLETSVGLDDCDLIATLRAATPAHALRIAARRPLSEPVVETLVQIGDAAAIERLLKNPAARFPPGAIDAVVRRARERPHWAPLLLRREEMRAGQGLALFWCADHAERLAILRRFASDRATLIAEFGDLLARAAAQNWSDPEARKALQFIERRQRSRVAAARSPFGSLENAVVVAAERGLTADLATEIAYLAGLRPRVGLRILLDPGGEPIAVLAKACGLKRPHLVDLCAAVSAMSGVDGDGLHARAELAYETLATAKAQTVLRHWNWALSIEAETLGVDDDPLFELTEEAELSPVNGARDEELNDWRVS